MKKFIEDNNGFLLLAALAIGMILSKLVFMEGAGLLILFCLVVAGTSTLKNN